MLTCLFELDFILSGKERHVWSQSPRNSMVQKSQRFQQISTLNYLPDLIHEPLLDNLTKRKPLPLRRTPLALAAYWQWLSWVTQNGSWGLSWWAEGRNHSYVSHSPELRFGDPVAEREKGNITKECTLTFCHAKDIQQSQRSLVSPGNSI